MTPQTYLSGLVMSFLISVTLECSQKNTSCSDIKTAEGFRFSHLCPLGSSLLAIDNKTNIAVAVLGTQKVNYLDEVMSLDNQSVVTRECRDLRITCSVPNGHFRGEISVKDVCVDYWITKNSEELKNADPSDPPTPLTSTNVTDSVPVHVIVGVTVGVLVLCGIAALCYWYIFRKRHQDGQGGRKVRADDLDTTHNNGVIRMSEISASVGADNTEQDNTLGSVVVHGSDGRTPPSLSLDCILRDKGIQPNENGDISGPNVSRASNHGAVNGSLGDDPGGLNDDKAKGSIRIGEKLNGWTPCDRGPDDGSDEGQPLMIKEKLSGRTLGDRGPDDGNDESQRLMSDQRAANQDSDMTGGAVALVDKHGSDLDPVSRCSTAPDTDVESTPTQKN